MTPSPNQQPVQPIQAQPAPEKSPAQAHPDDNKNQTQKDGENKNSPLPQNDKSKS